MLNAFDDFPVHQTAEPIAHPATSDPNFYDRTWFNGYRNDGELFFGFGMATYPHRNILDCHFSVAEKNGRQHCFYGSRRAPEERTDMTVGPCRFEIIEPMRRSRLIIDDNESGVSCDLTFSARTSPLEEAHQTRLHGTRAVMDATRFAVFGRWSGTISHPDGDITLDEETWLGTKDRSWGVRTVGERVQIGAPSMPSGIFFLWAPLQWDDHISHAIFFDRPDGRPEVREALTAPLFSSEADIPASFRDVSTPMATAIHRLEYQPGTRWIAKAELDFIDARGGTRSITLTPGMAFPFRGLGYWGDWKQGMWKGELAIGGETIVPGDLAPLDVDNIHQQQFVTAIDDQGRTGVGALEHLFIGPYEPYGFTDFFDGAP